MAEKVTAMDIGAATASEFIRIVQSIQAAFGPDQRGQAARQASIRRPQLSRAACNE
ncbi:hypothetical protein [Mycolicibacterium sp.]|uniref:hypothetical protein n=1 Tax=Mycolicibacterium sp. TaxID=2320850 RepID=UPI00355F7853